MTTRAQLYHCDHVELAAIVARGGGGVDCVVTDPPFGRRTHQGQRVRRRDTSTGVAATGLPYDAWSDADARVLVDTWHRLTRRWLCILCSHDLIPSYEAALRDVGRVVFAPVPCVIRGMGVRLCGDGPSSWTVYLLAARPRGMRPLSGTLPGAYVGPRERTKMLGEKPKWLMHDILCDYVRATDVVCDPCAGRATTLVAAQSLGIVSLGCEINAERYAAAVERIHDEHDDDQTLLQTDPVSVGVDSSGNQRASSRRRQPTRV